MGPAPPIHSTTWQSAGANCMFLNIKFTSENIKQEEMTRDFIIIIINIPPSIKKRRGNHTAQKWDLIYTCKLRPQVRLGRVRLGHIFNLPETHTIVSLYSFYFIYLCPLFNTHSSAASQSPLCRRMLGLNLIAKFSPWGI
jgi:hypothetical protein